MNCSNALTHISDYLDGDLTAAQRAAVDQHLDRCATCRAAYDRLLNLQTATAALPQRLEPGRDLWPGIAARLPDTAPTEQPARPNRPARTATQTRRFPYRGLALAASVLLLLTLGGLWFIESAAPDVWTVTTLQGTPRTETGVIGARGTLPVGARLETDFSSRATVDVGAIGNVEVAPNSALRLVRSHLAEYRIALDRGSIRASIWAPPRLFVVDTPTATAIDLGCVYTLDVEDNGAGRLHVESGWVALKGEAHSVVVPAGATCRTYPDRGPGLPYFENAAEPFKQTVATLDAGPVASALLDTLIAHARPSDSITLWHLLDRTEGDFRVRLLDALIAQVPLPDGVTRAGLLTGDTEMFEEWEQDMRSYWGDLSYWEKAPLWKTVLDWLR